MRRTRPASEARADVATGSKTAWRITAVTLAAFFFLLAMRSDVYEATSPHSLTHAMFGNRLLGFEHPWWLSVHFWLRKSYSVVAFALVAFAVHRALEPTARPVLRAAIVGGVYSLAIEFGQRIFVGYEPVLESVLDVGCGALGGWLAMLIDARATMDGAPSGRISRRARDCADCAGER